MSSRRRNVKLASPAMAVISPDMLRKLQADLAGGDFEDAAEEALSPAFLGAAQAYVDVAWHINSFADVRMPALS